MSRSLDVSLVISPTKFAHIVFRTKQLKVMVNWYARVLGTKSAYENDFAAFVTYDDEHHRLAFLQLPDLVEAPPQSIGLEHFAYTFESLGDLMQTYKRLKSEGISPAWTINHGPTTSLYYDDPDGNRVELQIDNFKSAAEALRELADIPRSAGVGAYRLRRSEIWAALRVVGAAPSGGAARAAQDARRPLGGRRVRGGWVLRLSSTRVQA